MVESVKHLAKFKEVVAHLQAKDLKRFFEFLYGNDLDSTLNLLIEALPDFQYTALCEAISVLREHKREDAVASALRKPWGTWQAEVDVMYWLASNMEKVAEWKLGSTSDLAARLLRVIEKEYTGDRLRVANQVRELFRDPKWLARILGDMDTRQLRALAQAVRDSTAWQKLDHASVMGQMVKLKPEIEEIISGRSGESEASNRKLMTSVRSYTTRQQQLQKITLKDIPENTRELALARSYGDLRENFEFQSAKDNQRTLMQRQGELEQMLRKVAPTNFEGCTAAVVGMGTTVVVRFDDGRVETFHILGEWDSEPAMNVISCSSALAKAIEGRKAGDRVRVPSSIGEQDATVESLSPLSPGLIEWASVAIEKLPESASFDTTAPAPPPPPPAVADQPPAPAPE
ncbi:MAG: GreA/GreB family elongation factor [Kiritimatiellia bacterium]